MKTVAKLPFTQKYAIMQLLEDIPEGTQFASSDWPPHVTIVGPFAIDWDVPTMIDKLARLLEHRKPAASVATGDDFFGPERQTKVVLLQKTKDLLQLHYDVVDALQEGGLRLNNPEYAREGFRPHSTVQKRARLAKGDRVVFDALTIIDMFPEGDAGRRRVVRTVRVGQP